MIRIILDNLIEIKINSKNCQHYITLGYNCKCGDVLLVKPTELQDGSAIKELRRCDCCGEIYGRRHSQHINSFKKWNKDLCLKCVRKGEFEAQTQAKRKQTCIEKYGQDNPSKVSEFQKNREETMVNKYGVINYFQAESFRDKAIKTSREKYGTDFPSQNEEVQKKNEETCLKKYGVTNATLNPIIRQKQINTCLEKYGGVSSLSNEEVRQKSKETMLKLYGCENASQSAELKEKAAQTRLKNGNGISTSKQQLQLKEILEQKYPDFDCVLNYVVSFLFLDIALIKNNLKIDVEYDGSYWHKDFQKDRRRDEFLKSQGFKILRIRSGHLLPTQEQIEQAIEQLKGGKNFVQITLEDWNN